MIAIALIMDRNKFATNEVISRRINNYHYDTEIKLTNYSNRKEYRNRIDKMYKDINEIIPIDNEIDNILYFIYGIFTILWIC